ncbi:dephospho-CoA kinase [Vannielia sp.]|uniref:dephospho-CoA kinase n=1 Tax=Vannielia sp. TaxID=2813045 RepID=UPI00261F9136|nr:dephospho-CoA kinase [Vannielia sp.]MDF1873403.1 dephospho-CoA kinase [Vannielia sp.]
MSETFRIGLTGGIGMGKSTTAKLFAEAGVSVWDADAAVHRLYAKGGAGVAAIEAIRPEAVVDGEVSRTALRDWIGEDPSALKQIEAVIHPLVQADRAAFSPEDNIALFDIPLLFETGADAEMALTVTVSCSPEEQRRRVLERGVMDAAEFAHIKAAQMPDAEKRQRADRTIVTDTPEHAREQVAAILAEVKEMRDA